MSALGSLMQLKRKGDIVLKKYIATLLMLGIIVFTAGAAFAHPPKDVVASWDKSNGILTVTANHNVNDPAKHYILSMTIFDGNKQLLLKQYSSQAAAEQFKDSVALKGLPSGTKLRIQLLCNIMGSEEATFIVP